MVYIGLRNVRIGLDRSGEGLGFVWIGLERFGYIWMGFEKV